MPIVVPVHPRRARDVHRGAVVFELCGAAQAARASASRTTVTLSASTSYFFGGAASRSACVASRSSARARLMCVRAVTAGPRCNGWFPSFRPPDQPLATIGSETSQTTATRATVRPTAPRNPQPSLPRPPHNLKCARGLLGAVGPRRRPPAQDPARLPEPAQAHGQVSSPRAGA